MHRVEFSMHRSTGLITLGDIIRKLPDNDWTWHMLDFYGIGVAPDGMHMSDFEELARAEGYAFDWSSFRWFAERAEQSWDCLVVALGRSDTRSAKEITDADCAGAYVVIEAFDSSTWTIRSKDELPLQEFLDG